MVLSCLLLHYFLAKYVYLRLELLSPLNLLTFKIEISFFYWRLLDLAKLHTSARCPSAFPRFGSS